MYRDALLIKQWIWIAIAGAVLGVVGAAAILQVDPDWQSHPLRLAAAFLSMVSTPSGFCLFSDLAVSAFNTGVRKQTRDKAFLGRRALLGAVFFAGFGGFGFASLTLIYDLGWPPVVFGIIAGAPMGAVFSFVSSKMIFVVLGIVPRGDSAGA